MERRTLLTTAAGLAASGLAGCLDVLGQRADDEGGDWDVGMTLRDFTTPNGALEVEVGSTVTWRNTSQRAHTVTAYDDQIPADAEYFASGGFESEAAAREAWNGDFGGRIDSGGEFEHTFETVGEYTYFCIPHEAAGMAGVIRVVEA